MAPARIRHPPRARLPPVVEPDRFPVAERCALRLDGDCFDLGLTVVPVDVPVGPAIRAATLTTATGRHGLVAELRTAAWVHGARPRLPNPLDLALDLGSTRRNRQLRPAPRERRFGPGDVVVLGDVRLTSPFRTAFDLVHREPGAADLEAVVHALLPDRSPDAARAAGLALPGCNGKHATIDRLVRILTR